MFIVQADEREFERLFLSKTIKLAEWHVEEHRFHRIAFPRWLVVWLA